MKQLIIFFLILTGGLLKGAVVFFDQGVLLTQNLGLFEIDFDGNGTTDVSFEKFTSPFFINGISGSSTTSIIVNSDPSISGAQPLDQGELIGPILSEPFSFLNLEFNGRVGRLQLLSAFTSGDLLIEQGPFFRRTAYAGFSFEGEEGTHYGYALIRDNDAAASITVLNWAYESEPGVAIVAGAIPEPSTFVLCLLSVIPVFRRRRPSS